MKKKRVLIIILIFSLGLGGFFLLSEGNDAVTIAAQEKGSILTAEQVNVSFQQVGGKIIDLLVQEGQQVKKGDILMVLDPTDIDLQVAKVESELSSMDARIEQAEESLKIEEQKITIQEQQAKLELNKAQTAENQVNDAVRDEDIARQKIAVESARKSMLSAKDNYNRTKELYDSQAISKVSLDNAEIQLALAEDKLQQEEELLKKLINGSTKEEREQARLRTEQAKSAINLVEQNKKDLENKKINIDLLRKQKEILEIQLKTLLVQKERLTLKAPEDGKIIRIVGEIGENVGPGAPTVILETNRLYFDFYVEEDQVTKFHIGDIIPLHLVALKQEINGIIELVTTAPQFATLRKTREQGLSDLNTFQIRVYIEQKEDILPGMTVEVNLDEIASR